MNTKYKPLLDFCSKVNDNMDNFMKGQYLPFGDDTHATQDPVYDSLMEAHEFDAATELYLRVIFPALAVLCTRLFKDHLQGGIHGSLDVNDPTLRQKYKSVPKSRKYAESIFGLLDHFIASSLCWYLVGGEEACVSQGLWELYRWGLKPLADLTKPGRSQGRDQTKPSTWSSRLGVGRGANNPTL